MISTTLPCCLEQNNEAIHSCTKIVGQDFHSYYTVAGMQPRPSNINFCWHKGNSTTVIVFERHLKLATICGSTYALTIARGNDRVVSGEHKDLRAIQMNWTVVLEMQNSMPWTNTWLPFILVTMVPTWWNSVLGFRMVRNFQDFRMVRNFQTFRMVRNFQDFRMVRNFQELVL